MPGIKKQSTSYSAKATVPGETKDCHVRALALVLGISYDESHQIHKEEGRVDGKPTFYSTSQKISTRFGLAPVRYENTKYGRDGDPTIKQFVWDHPKGKYLVHRSGHAFAVIDGVVHDWNRGTGPRSRVVWAAKFGD